jgi:hypothetical protein
MDDRDMRGDSPDGSSGELNGLGIDWREFWARVSGSREFLEKR